MQQSLPSYAKPVQSFGLTVPTQLESKGNWVLDLIYGNYSLARTFWLYNILLMVIAVIIAQFFWSGAYYTGNVVMGIIAIPLCLFNFVFSFACLTGLWMSARKYTGSTIWKFLAQAYCIINVLSSLVNFILGGIGALIKLYG